MSYFGTDGVRGPFGQFPITPSFLLDLGMAAGLLLRKKNVDRPTVLIGKDTRASCDAIAAALQAGLNAVGVDTRSVGVIPTPAIAHLTKTLNADMGVVISASHNPYSDNGVKFFDKNGCKLSDADQAAIDKTLQSWLDRRARSKKDDGIFDPKRAGQHTQENAAKDSYVAFCKQTISKDTDLRSLRVVLDCANGSASDVAVRVFGDLGAQVVATANAPDGYNINDRCGSTYPKALQDLVKAHKADIGVAFDGDGDRVLLVDESGKAVDGDGILYLLATHSKTPPKGVVGTQMSNMALEVALKARGIDFARAKVGDRYVMQELQKRGWLLGGEPSGHILCLDKTCSGDAIVAALQAIECMRRAQKPLGALLSSYKPMAQTLLNVRVGDRRDPYADPELAALFAQAEKQLGDKGRLLVRPSGTEPVVRIMVESAQADVAFALAHRLKNSVEKRLT